MSSLAIIWRNPKQVRNRLRWSQQEQPGGRTLYVVQQLLPAGQDVWVNAAVFEVIRGRQTVAAPQQHTRAWRFGFSW
jgi:hypothetical protein